MAASFASLAFVLSFTFPFILAFPELKSIATAGLGFWGHIAVLREKMSNQRLKSALVKSGCSFPKTDVGFELGPSTERCNEDVNAGEFGDVVSGSLKKFVVTGGVATEVAELSKLRKGCSNGRLGGGDFVMRNRSESGLEFFN